MASGKTHSAAREIVMSIAVALAVARGQQDIDDGVAELMRATEGKVSAKPAGPRGRSRSDITDGRLVGCPGPCLGTRRESRITIPSPSQCSRRAIAEALHTKWSLRYRSDGVCGLGSTFLPSSDTER